MSCKAPGKGYREGVSVSQFFKMFPDNRAAEDWFIKQRWPHGIACIKCGSLNVNTNSTKKGRPFRCREKECQANFSIKIGTFMQSSKIGYQDWLFAIYLISTNLKSVSSMKLHRDLGVTQKTAWHLAHRIRRALVSGDGSLFAGPVEVDESYFGGRRRNMSKSRRAVLDGRGPKGKTAVIGVKDRRSNQVSAKVIQDTSGQSIRGFVIDNVQEGARIYSDEARAYEALPNREAVQHSIGEYARGQVHTNGIESFWAVLKRAHKGTFHRLSPKHLHRYIGEFAERHNLRELDTLDLMAAIVRRMEGAQLRYKDLVA